MSTFERLVSPLGVVVRESEVVRFSTYSDDELRKLSVVQVHSSEQRDAMNRPLPGGLYDPKMGPTDDYSSCPTCGLDYRHCPGHLGRIELVLPVYLPVLFPVLVKMLRAKCMHCHAFRFSRKMLRAYIDALALTDAGLLIDAAAVLGWAARPRRNGSDETRCDEGGEDCTNDNRSFVASRYPPGLGLSEEATVALKRVSRTSPMPSLPPCASRSPHAITLRRDAVHGFYVSLLGAKSCEHCNRVSATIRPEGGCKLFCTVLGKGKQAANATSDAADVSDKEKEREDDDVDSPAAAVATAARGGDARDGDERDAGSVDDEGDVDSDSDDRRNDTPHRSGVAAAAPSVIGGGPEHGTRFMTPKEALRHMELLWGNEKSLLTRLFRGMGAQSFFMQVVPVPPNRFRPPATLTDGIFEHSSNVLLGRVLANGIELRRHLAQSHHHQQQAHQGSAAAASEGVDTTVNTERVIRVWDDLCRAVASISDSTTSGARTDREPPGVKQLLERKQGLFRMNMMGKRVNFTCRSVISPDPNIGTNEIGIPDRFAKVLTFPEPITPFNVSILRQAVINGPSVHPGATMVQDSTGFLIDLSRQSAQQRTALAKRLLVSVDTEATPVMKFREVGDGSGAVGAPGSTGGAAGGAAVGGAAVGGTAAAASKTPCKPGGSPAGGSVKRVWRHLRNGDALLLNRQPTLHKPGIMAHVCKVLRGEKVIRMHYANCNTYNADFDGDEMNVHMCQTELARAEAYEIAATDEQYIAPTNGKPLRGIIQDHVVAGVYLTKRDTFMDRSLFVQLLQLANMDLCHHSSRVARLPAPAILKPQTLWTGKQVISHLILHLHPDAKHLSMQCSTKTPASAWTAAPGRGSPKHEDGLVVVQDGELLCGVLDKSSFGSTEFGLVHSVHEVLGGEATGSLLTQLGRLFTGYLQAHGFTCGIGDLLLTPEADVARRELLKNAGVESVKGLHKFLGFAALPPAAPPSALRAAVAESLNGVQAGRADGVLLDGSVKERLMPLASRAGTTCLPSGQRIPFPTNHFAAMTSTGAKGSGVNFSQISVMLGQQELEGRRVPLSPSGCTAPCFAPFDLSARAGGYITDRFLTGIRPPEFYFHCMAGREGLVDTAVKTSRSGYLQRCLIKHLETLQVEYDYTVRSTADGSVVQFVVGEDGLDPTRISFLQQPEFFARNARVLQRKWEPPKRAPKSMSAVVAISARNARIIAERDALAQGKELAPLLSQTAPGAALGVVSKKFEEAIEEYLPKLGVQSALISTGLPPQQGTSTRRGATNKAIENCDKAPRPKASFAEDWKVLMWRKYQASLHHPGEAVGLLAAQSVGEPSTQMTLNTFHLAGRGEANVTLGIPRMREIIMVASKQPSTPLMTLPLAQSAKRMSPLEADALAANLASKLNRIKLSDAVRQVFYNERLLPEGAAEAEHGLRLKRRVMVRLYLGRKSTLTASEISLAFVAGLLVSLKMALKKKLKATSKPLGASSAVGQQHGRRGGNEFEGDGGACSCEDGGGESRGGETTQAEDGGATSAADADDDADDAKAAQRAMRSGEGVDYEEDYEDGDNDEIENIQSPGEEEDGEDFGGGAEQHDAVRERIATARAELLVNRFGWGIIDFGEENGNHHRSGSGSGDVPASILWFELELPVEGTRILLLPLVESLMEGVLVRSTERIYSAVVVPAGKGRTLPNVQTAGVNFSAVASKQFAEMVELVRVASNDVHAVLQFYGVEAARATIVNEIKSVFGVYGISVDPRHLGLIADYMTHEGAYTPLNRAGIESCASPLLKMSFETTMHFLSHAMLHNEPDTLTSPSASIILGRVPKCGTGSFELHAHLHLDKKYAARPE